MPTRRVLVTGAAGQLGGVIRELFGDGGDDVTALTRVELDLTEHDAVLRAVRDAQPNLMVNCAAYNQVDAAEDDATSALAVNAFSVRSLARAASDVGATFVHYSTDFVFDGRGAVPYTEENQPSPQSVYGASKLLGEWFAADVPRAYVLRVESLFGGRPAKSSVDRISDAILDGREVPVFIDRTVSPSYVQDVAGATRTLVDAEAPPGLYHCVNSGYGTWWELAEEIGRQLGVTPKLKPVAVETVKLRAPRPKYCALSNTKLTDAGFTMPMWQDALGRYLKVRTDGRPRT